MTTPETSAEKRSNYEEQPLPGDFSYHIITPESDAVSTRVELDIVQPAEREVRERYGIGLSRARWGEIPESEGKIPYILIGQ